MSAKLAVRSEPNFPRTFSSVTVKSGRSTPESVLGRTKNMGLVRNCESMIRESWTRLTCSLELETSRYQIYNQHLELEFSHSVETEASCIISGSCEKTSLF